MEVVQVVARYRGIHVVLDVVVHLPIEKSQDRVQVNGPCAQTEVVDVVHQAAVLGVVAEKKEPCTIGRSE